MTTPKKYPSEYFAQPIHKQLQDIFEEMSENLGQRLVANELLSIQFEETRKQNPAVEIKCKMALYDFLRVWIYRETVNWSSKHPHVKLLEVNLRRAEHSIENGKIDNALRLLIGVYEALKTYREIERRKSIRL